MKRFVAGISTLALLFPVAAGAAPTAPHLRDGYAPFDRATLRVESALVIDADTGETLFSHHADEPHTLASLTKLMSAVIFLEHQPSWTTSVALDIADEVGGGRLRLPSGTLLSVRDLFYAALVGSANNAAMALARVSGLARDTFIREMNIRAATLGMNQTRFFEPSGMDARNISTAEDIARLARYAFGNPAIRRATTTGRYKLVASSPYAVRTITNTNRLLVVDPDIYITGGKTGYLDDSRYNLVIRARGSYRHQVIVVVLGASVRDASFDDAKHLSQWAFENYEWN